MKPNTHPTTAPRAQQSTPLVFSPLTGSRCDPVINAEGYRVAFVGAWRFNPWTGNPRLTPDIDTDPLGRLIVPPGEPLVAAAPPPVAVTAADLLDRAAGHMRDRAATYDSPQGERSMGAAVAAFNALTGRDLTESEGWLLLVQLKLVRDQSRAEPHADSLEDAPAYAALYGESRLQGR